MREDSAGLDHVLGGLVGPVLIVSTKVGRGMYSLGEALEERLRHRSPCIHIAIEDYLPARAVDEDLRRYKFISNHFKILLNLVYKIPFFYWRKYVRESALGTRGLHKLRDVILSSGTQTVICVSHRPAFWVSKLKQQEGLHFKLWGLLGEYGKNLGWRYQFWDQIDGFMSPVAKEEIGISLPAHVDLVPIQLPSRLAYEEIAGTARHARDVLLICGLWGQGPFVRLVWEIRRALPAVRCHVVCGENHFAERLLRSLFPHDQELRVYGVVDSLVPLLRTSRAIVTKPGIATLIEAHAARRKIFLVPGMPVAEANNARHALRYFQAEWFTAENLRRYYEAQ
jgi:UDP-N-acetylglucosamine:LPS N-acetylglucosamine transferase